MKIYKNKLRLPYRPLDGNTVYSDSIAYLKFELSSFMKSLWKKY